MNIPHSFIAELKALIAKYNVTTEEHDVYDGQERYVGMDIYLVFGDHKYYQQTLKEILDEINPK